MYQRYQLIQFTSYLHIKQSIGEFYSRKHGVNSVLLFMKAVFSNKNTSFYTTIYNEWNSPAS